MDSSREINNQPARPGAGTEPTYQGVLSNNQHTLYNKVEMHDSGPSSTWKDLFVFTDRHHTGFLSVTFIAALLVAAIKILYAIILGKIMDIISPLGAGSINGRDAMDGVTFWCVVMALAGMAICAFNSAFMALWIIFGELVARAARRSLFSNMLAKDMAWFDSHKKGLSSVLGGVQIRIRELQMATSQVFGFLVNDAFVAIGCVIIAFYHSWQLTLVLMATIPVSAVVINLVSRGLGKAVDAQKRELHHASQCIVAAVTAIDLVKTYNGFDQEVWRYLQIIQRAMRWYLQQARQNAMQMGFFKFWMINLFVVGFWFAVNMVSRNSTTPGNALTSFYAVMTALQSLENVGPQWLVFVKGMSAGHSLQKIILATGNHTARRMNGFQGPDVCVGDIQFNAVSFAYPSNPSRIVLNRATLLFPAGGLTFIVGKSGSGKSTIPNLLLKFYEPLTGNILIDGQPIRTLDGNWIRDQITLIQQTSVLFTDTILMNVALGSRNLPSVGREDVKAACETVLLQAALAALPDGLDTNVGIGGHALSGGQAQRLSLARARLRDPPVLILDEVTSAIDPASKVPILEAIRTWRAGKTTIIITHDVSQIRNEDFVYVLDRAYLVQEGFRRDLEKDEAGIFASLMALSDDGSGDDANITASSIDSGPKDSSSLELPDQIPITQVSRHSCDKEASTKRGAFRMSIGAAMERSTTVGTKTLWSTPIETNTCDRERDIDTASYAVTTGGRSVSVDKRGNRIWDQDTYSPQLKLPSSGKESLLDIVLERGGKINGHGCHTMGRRIVQVEQRQKDMEGRVSMASTASSFRDAIPSGCRYNSKAPTKTETVCKDQMMSLSKILGTVWPVLDGVDRIRAVLGLVLCVVAAACNSVFAYVFARLLAAFWAPPAEMAASGQIWAVRLAILAAVDGSATFSANYFLQCAGQGWVTGLRIEAMKRILSQPKHWFQSPSHSPQRISEVLICHAEEMQNLVGRFVPVVLIVVAMILSSLVWALAVSWKLTLVTLAAGPAVYAVTRGSASVSAKWETRCDAASKATGAVTMEALVNIRVVRALTLEEYFLSKHAQSTDTTFRVGVMRGIRTGVLYGLSQSMSWWLTALVFWYATALLTSPGPTTSVTNIMQVINLLLFSTGTATAMMSNIPQIAQAKAASIQVLYYATLSYSTSHESRGEKRPLTALPVVMRNLQFGYPSLNEYCKIQHRVLRNVNLRIDAGDCVAIVGTSGCGKSTILNLLLRLYEPSGAPGAGSQVSSPASTRQDDGQEASMEKKDSRPECLTYAHVAASDLSTPILRTYIAHVPQHPFLFPTTIFENIVYGLHPDSPLRELCSVVRAAKLACIHDFIASLPEGYATVVGEGGVGLSGGQAQCVNTARALVRRPQLLVMDEPTSALDADGAEGIRRTLRGLMARSRGGREGDDMAVVIVTHSREMMRMAGRIAVMHQGVVAEEGGFEELMAAKGKLAELLLGT